MDDKYRKHIKKNIEELKRLTTYRELVLACQQQQLISRVMCNIIESIPDATEDKKHEELFLKLTRRGPDAYDKLIKILIDLHFSKAATLLDSQRHVDDIGYKSINNPANIKQNAEELKHAQIEDSPPVDGKIFSKIYSDTLDEDAELLVPYTTKIESKTFEVKKATVLQGDTKLPCYPMKSQNRGVFVMVNIFNFDNSNSEKRSGSDRDEMSLLHLFQELGFTCFAYRDLSSKEFFNILEALRSSNYLKDTECFLLALMSHGEMRSEDLHDRVEFYDGSVRKAKDIEDFFSNENCPSLIGKPKVFLFPFCRGSRPDKGVQTDSRSKNPIRNVPTRSDMMVIYACDKDFQALRDPNTGSFYVQIFCEVLAENAHDTHLENMLKMIGGKVKNLRSLEGYLQTPSYCNYGFNKALYFNPGVCE